MDDLTRTFLANCGSPASRRAGRTGGEKSRLRPAGRKPLYGPVTGRGTELAIRVKLARHRRGWSREELVRQADVSRRCVEMVESGHEVLPPGLGALKRIEEALELRRGRTETTTR